MRWAAGSWGKLPPKVPRPASLPSPRPHLPPPAAIPTGCRRYFGVLGFLALPGWCLRGLPGGSGLWRRPRLSADPGSRGGLQSVVKANSSEAGVSARRPAGCPHGATARRWPTLPARPGPHPHGHLRALWDSASPAWSLLPSPPWPRHPRCTFVNGR